MDRPASAASTAPVIALLGAESTGKSTLTQALAEALQAEGLTVGRVDEYLREFCERSGRTPRCDEQAFIAAEQTRRIGAARAARLPPPDMVVADTTALMTAVYSDLIFGDTTLYAQALADHRQADLTLLMALDLPWVADPLRDGPQVQQPVDRLLRTALIGAGIPFAVISGSGPQRLAAALSARAAWQRRIEGSACPAQGWQHVCGRCGDATCVSFSEDDCTRMHRFPQARPHECSRLLTVKFQKSSALIATMLNTRVHQARWAWPVTHHGLLNKA